MTALARYLETLYSAADEMPHAVDASIASWRDDAATGSRRPVVGKKKPSASSASSEARSVLHAQLRLPTHARIATDASSSGEARYSLVVLNRDEWHVVKRDGSVERGSDGSRRCPHLIDVQRHFDGAMIREFFVSLRLEDRGAVDFAGAECVRFRAVPRVECHLWPHWLPHDADEYEFIGEIATGFLLSIAGLVKDRVCESHEVSRIERDAVLDDDTFTFRAAPAEVREAAEAIVRLNSPSAAQSRVEFTVFVPQFLPDAERLQSRVMIQRLSRSDAPRVEMFYSGAPGFRYLSISQGATADPKDDEFEWEEAPVRDATAKISDPGDEGLRIVSLQKEGTHISITTDLGRAAALDVASSLSPCEPGGREQA